MSLFFTIIFIISTSINYSTCVTHACNSSTYVFKRPGDVMLAAIVGAHSGEDCSIPEINGLQTVQSIIASVDAVRINNILSGLSLGLSIYDSCSQDEMAKKSIISALVDAQCEDAVFLGILIEEGVEPQVRNITTDYGVSMFTLKSTIPDNVLASITARTIYDLHLMPVNKLISSNEHISGEFLSSASAHGICVNQLMSLTEIDKITPSDTVVIFSTYSELENTVTNINSGRTIFIPLNGEHHKLTDLKLPPHLMVLLPTTLEFPELLNPFNLTEKPFDSDFFIKTRTRVNIQQVQTLSDILRIVGHLKRHIKAHCPDDSEWTLCTDFPRFPRLNSSSEKLTSLDSMRSNLKFLRAGEDEFEASVLLEWNSDIQKLGSIKLSNNKWLLDTEVNITDEEKVCKSIPTNDTGGYDCSDCINFSILYKEFFEQKLDIFSIVGLRQEAWVAALLSISTVGVLCSTAIAVFIVVRICKKDMLEGNPGFSFLLLLSITFMYCSILPFSFEVIDDNHHYYKGLFCGLKIFGTSLSYSLVFSIMLARSFMLASCDEDGGFMSHVNGYLQTVLCFFIAAVQLALTLQFWAINWLLMSQQQCAEMSKGLLFLFLLGYDMFLLLILLSVTPFIVKSKRNYHEGGYFTVSTYICLGVWVAWCTGYILLPQWEDVCICCGLVATATVILVTVFIPRTYLMLTGIVRDHIVSTLPSLNHTASTSIVDVNYRSTQALYDSVTIPRGNMNPNYYADRPTTPSTSKMEDDRMEATYERYESSPSPRNITRF